MDKCNICQEFKITVFPRSFGIDTDQIWESGIDSIILLCDPCCKQVTGAVDEFMLTVTRAKVTLKTIEELQKFQRRES